MYENLLVWSNIQIYEYNFIALSAFHLSYLFSNVYYSNRYGNFHEMSVAEKKEEKCFIVFTFIVLFFLTKLVFG